MGQHRGECRVTLRTPAVACAVLLAALAAACRSKPDPAPVDAAASAAARAPVLSFSQRIPPRRPDGGGSVPTDGRERTRGKALNADARAACKDDQRCLFAKCSEKCFAFVRDAYEPAELRGVHHKNQLYFNCTGACIDPSAPER